jgi:hypothetical protein
MEAFFKDLVCHGGHNDSFDHSSSDGGDSPRTSIPRSDTQLVASGPVPKGRRSSTRSLKADWGCDKERRSSSGGLPVWEDMPPADTIAEPHSEASGALEEFDVHSKPLCGSMLIPAIARIPKLNRLSFHDENEGVNIMQANTDPTVDRCKAMAMATQQAEMRADAARAMLQNDGGPPKRSVRPSSTSGRSPAPKSPNANARPPSPLPKSSGKLGFGSSGRGRLETFSKLHASPMHSSRAKKRCETPDTSRREPKTASQRPSPLSKRSPGTTPRPSPLPARPQRPPPTPGRTPRCSGLGPPPSPLRQPSLGQSPGIARQQSQSFMINLAAVPGPPRCNSIAQSQVGRSASTGRMTGAKRQTLTKPPISCCRMHKCRLLATARGQ